MKIFTYKVSVSLIFSGVLALLLFYTGLGLSRSLSDFQFWYHSSRLTIGLEWGFILLYFLISNRFFPLISLLFSRYRSTVIIAILWFTTVFISYITSNYYSWENFLAELRLVETITELIFFLVLWDFFSNYQANYSIIFSATAAPGIILALLLGLGFALDLSTPGTWGLHLPHWGGLHLNDNIRRLGYQLVISSVSLFYFFRSPHVRPVIFFLYVLMVFFIFWLGGRASFLGLAGAIILFSYMLKDRRITMTILLATIAALILFLWADHLSLLGTDLGSHSIIERTFLSHNLDQISSGRLELWSMVFNSWLEHPWLGAGPQSCFFLPVRNVMVIHPHNFLLQFLLEWGIVGTFLFLLLLYRALLYGWKHYHHDVSREQKKIALSLLFSLTIIGLFGGSYFFPQTSIFLILSFALWCSY